VLLAVLALASVQLVGLPQLSVAAPAALSVPVPVPKISPAPQQIRRTSDGFALPGTVRLAPAAGTAPVAVQAVTAELRNVGSRVATASAPMIVRIGRSALADLHAPSADHLPAGGYVLATGRHAGTNEIVMAGADAAGTFYAAQTLRQLITRSQGGAAWVPGVQIVDWPQFGMRGGEESFYGDAWQQADLVHQMDFLGQDKMNEFLYTPGGDPHTLSGQWRALYTATELAPLQAAVSEARANFVDFMYRIDPEAQLDPPAGICHGSTTDLNALVARYQQLWDIGIHTVSVGWDDAGGQFVCALDQQMFRNDASPLAAAQAYVINYVNNNFIATHPGARLITVPAEYAGDSASTYRTRFARLIPNSVTLFWTGPQVVSPTITASDLSQAQQAFGGRQLLIFDNYPVNDYVANQQHLGPLVGRDPALAGNALGLMANEMPQAEPSLIALYTVGDFTWNPGAYSSASSWTASLQELGGSVYGALRTYAENSVASPLTTDVSPVVQPLIANFEQAYRAHGDITATSNALLAELARVVQAPAMLRSSLTDTAFVTESDPYLATLQALGAAATDGVDALLATNAGDNTTATQDLDQMGQQMAAAHVTGKIVAPGMYDQFLAFAAGPRSSTVLQNDAGAMSAFGRGTNGQMYTSSQSSAGSSWGGFTALGGNLSGPPDVIIGRSGVKSVFAQSGGAMWTDWQTSIGGSWHGWVSLGGPIAGNPRVVQTHNGAFSVFARGTDGRMWTASQSAEGSTWNAFAALPGITITGRPDVIVGRSGVISVFAQSHGAVWTDWQTSVGGSWHGWVSLGGPIAGDPRVVQTDNGAFSVFARGTDGRVWTAWQSVEGGTWNTFVALAGISTTGTPDIIVAPNGAMNGFARGSDGAVWTNWQLGPGGAWHGWVSLLSGTVVGDPRIVENLNGAFSAFAIATNGAMYTSWQSSQGSTWSAWTSLGGSLTP
jgi:hypothetical protein